MVIQAWIALNWNKKQGTKWPLVHHALNVSQSFACCPFAWSQTLCKEGHELFGTQSTLKEHIDYINVHFWLCMAFFKNDVV
jgi:hypothetical protein